jgi:ATP-dependent exoDNAse (exonuclease V) beta subunit
MAEQGAGKRPADWRQRQEALDPTRSFIVQAPAGSGKTGLLTRRFLRLLTTVEHPEEIVAITFTRKAAAEMRLRVLEALASAQGPEPADNYAREAWLLGRAALAHTEARGWQLLQYPQRLRIRTIDSLCGYLVRQVPLECGFGEAPGVEEKARDLYLGAARSVLAELESEGALADALDTLLVELDNRVEALQDLIAGMLERREQWLPPLMQENSRALVEGVLKGVVERHLEQLRAAFGGHAVETIPALVRYAADNLAADHALSACRDLQVLPGSNSADLPAWIALADLLLVKDGNWRKGVDARCGFPPGAGVPAETKKSMLELLDSLRPDESLAKLLHGLRHLPDPGYSDDEWLLIQALFTVLKAAVAHQRVVFMEQGRVDFTETALAAQRALGKPEEPSDLALRLDYRLRHLLVDEFQDTSRSQYELFRLLTAGWMPGDGRTLFLVGDPMQSIYRFRQAEVGLFLDAWQGRLGADGVPLEALQLEVNFRSEAGLIDWVNAAFPLILPERGDPELGAVPHAHSTAWHSTGPGEDAQVAKNVTLYPFIGRDDVAESELVMKVIRQARRDDPCGTTAVLVRSKTHLDHLIAALRKQRMRFQAVEIGALQHRPAVTDLLSLTLALLHPADRLHWLALLHGPLGGLSLADLHQLTGADASDDRRHWRTIPALLADPACTAALSDDGRDRCARAWSVLGAALENRERKPLRDWVEGAWLALGGPLCLPDDGAAEDVEVFFQLVQDLDNGGRPVTPERIREGVEQLFSLPDPLADESLQLMTIHKAKGLEFDTVILPGLGKKPKNDGRKLLYWLETTGEHGEPELFFGPVRAAGSNEDPRTSAYIKNLEAAMGRLESGRLLYVAATRAKKRLYLFGHASQKKNGELSVDGSSLLYQMWPAVKEHWEAQRDARDEAAQEVREEPLATYGSVGAAGAEAPRLRVPSGWACPEPPATAGTAPGPEGIGEEPVLYEWAGDAARAVGTVVHRFLQHLARAEEPQWDALPQFEAVARRLLLGEGLPERQVEAALQRVRTALQRTLADERGQWILSAAHQDRRSELPLTAVIDGRVRHMVVDRSFVDADGIRWIIDYKTGTHAGGDVTGFLDQEQERYRAQLAGYAAAFRALEDRPVRTALYYPLVPSGWREVVT